MRFVWAVVAFVLATLLIGAGVAQRTVFLGPSEQQLELGVEEPAPFVLVDGEVLRSHPGVQTLIVRGEGDVFAAYGRTADIEAWLADSTYNAITLNDDGEPTTELVEPDAAADAPADGEAPAEPVVRNPAGSDLWLDSFSEPDQVITEMQLPEGMSILIAADGTAPAPSDIVVSWPLDTSTPWVGPLIVAGSAVLLFGIVMYILAIRHQRRGRGPRRKGPGPMPPTEPIALDPADERAAVTAAPKRRAITSRRRRLLVVPALAVVGLLAAGCSAESWPQFDAASPTPSPTPTVIAPENQKPPAVTQAQAARILQTISETLAQADAALDIELAATRLDGAALDARRTDYTLRKTLTDRAAPATIPTESIEVLLPQATDTWPRTVLALTKSKSDDTVPPVILTMTQADPWSNYKVTNLAEMQASAEVPKLAPEWLGTTLITDSASAFLSMRPDELAAAFADVVDAGEKSASYGRFDELSLKLAQSIRDSRQAVVQSLADNGAAETSSAAFDIVPSDKEPVALATLDSGAIVAVSLIDSETITPTTSDAVIKFGDNPEAKTLTGVEESAKGVKTTYGLQVFFAVPTQGSTEPLKLLGVHQDILNVEVIS